MSISSAGVIILSSRRCHFIFESILLELCVLFVASKFIWPSLSIFVIMSTLRDVDICHQDL